MQITAPNSLSELQQRCAQLAGQSLYDLATSLGISIPTNLLHAKGWVGQLIESSLGATASNKAIQDFPQLGVELKTIPISEQGQPLESTYVCTVQTNHAALQWSDSWVYHKLKHVLWVPIISSADLPIVDRRIETPVLWQMPDDIEQILRTDWEELMDMLLLGHAKELTAKFGTYLHIRPKAANSKVLVDYVAADGHATKIVPKGFYLRTSFTKKILGV